MTTTPQWHTSLKDLLYDNHKSLLYIGGDPMHLPSFLTDFIETQIAQARREGKEEMKNRCLEVIPETIEFDHWNNGTTYNDINTGLKLARGRISSL